MSGKYNFSNAVAYCRILLSLVLSVMFTSVQASEYDHGNERIWISNNRTYEQLSKDVAELYVALYNGGALPVEKIVDESGNTAISIMVDKKYFTGTYFPVEIDSLMCDLNPDYCSRTIVRSDLWANSSSAHVSLTQPTVGNWTNGKNDELLIPAISFEKIIDYSLHSIVPGDKVSRMVTEVTRGCETYDDQCRTRVYRRNRFLENADDIFDDSFVGDLFLPVLRLKSDLNIYDYVELTPEYASEMPAGLHALLVQQFPPSRSGNKDVDHDFIQLIESARTEQVLGGSSNFHLVDRFETISRLQGSNHIDRAIRLPNSIGGQISASFSPLIQFES